MYDLCKLFRDNCFCIWFTDNTHRWADVISFHRYEHEDHVVFVSLLTVIFSLFIQICFYYLLLNHIWIMKHYSLWDNVFSTAPPCISQLLFINFSGLPFEVHFPFWLKAIYNKSNKIAILKHNTNRGGKKVLIRTEEELIIDDNRKNSSPQYIVQLSVYL